MGKVPPSPEDEHDEYDFLMDTDEFKKTITILMKDFIEVKKQAVEIGYKAEAIKLRDYIDYYVRLNE